MRRVFWLSAWVGGGLSLVVAISAAQRVLIADWTGQQWFFAVLLPLSALILHLTGGFTLWWWARRDARPPVVKPAQPQPQPQAEPQTQPSWLLTPTGTSILIAGSLVAGYRSRRNARRRMAGAHRRP